MTETKEGAGKGWLHRVLRAVVIGFVIYYMMSTSISYVINKSRMNSGQGDGTQKIKDLNLPLGQLPPNETKLAIKQGYDWASERDVRSHAVCRERWVQANHDLLIQSGCSKYVTEQNALKVSKPIPPRRWDETTAECIADVHAYWDPLIQDLREKGDHHAAGSWTNRHMLPALRECENFDNIRIVRVIHEPQTKINTILDRVRNGGKITEQDKQTVKTDYPGVFSFPENRYRTQYLNSAEEFFKLAGGKDQVL